MSDPSTTPAPEGKSSAIEPAVGGKTKVLGLDYKVAGLLAYLPICAVNIIFSVIWLKTEPKENRFLRFHALQSLFLTIAFILLGTVVWALTMFFAFIPFLGFIASLIHLVWLGITLVYLWKCISAMIDAYNGKMSKIEFVGDLAEKNLQNI